MNWLRFITAQVVLFSASACLAAEPDMPSEKDKAAVLHQTAQDWMDVGIAQSKKGLYGQAEKSFLAAKEYEEYLTAAGQKQLEKYIAKANQATAENQPISEHQKGKLIGIYYRSVQLYNAGKFEKAREGFVEVAKYGLVVPKGRPAEDYLVQIDSILISPFRAVPDSNLPLVNKAQEKTTQPLPPVAPQPAKKKLKTKNVTQPSLPEGEVAFLKPKSDKLPVTKKADEQSPVSEAQEQTTEETEPPAKTVTSSANAQKLTLESKVEMATAEDPREKIARTYTKAVVEDAAAKVEYYVGRDELDKAVSAVRSATLAIRENRPLIGDELFVQYSVRLKQLADKIAKAHKVS
jgi:hypothetical protein